jgi:DNA-binding IscR family transcriptional regulator
VRDLCEAADVPDVFGASLVPFLVEAGMIRAEGYRDHLLSLARPATEMTMAEIIKACEPDFSLSQCTRNPLSCDRSARCGVHMMWAGLDQLIWRQLEELTLARVAAGHGPSCPVPDRRGAIDFTNLLGIA